MKYIKPRWRGTFLVVVGLIGCLAILRFTAVSSIYESKWLMLFFTIGMLGGVLAFIDAVLALLDAKKKRDRQD